MKSINTFLFRSAFVISALLASSIGEAANSTTSSDQSGDPGWPRERVQDGNRLIVYQPQLDDWKEFRDLSWRMAVSITPKGGKEVLGVVEMKGNTDVDNVSKMVTIRVRRRGALDPAPTMTYEGAGPHHIEVEQFDGFGPMGTAQLGDW
jgi:hypothetical protein